MCDYCSCRTIELIDQLGTEHERLIELSSAVRLAIGRGDRPRAESGLADLVDVLRVHDEVEEASIFAALTAAGELDGDVQALVADHAQTWVSVENLEARAGSAIWEAGVLALLDDLEAHIAREEYDLFPAALVAISPAGWSDAEADADEVRRRAA